jgi:hypothetical protein
VANPTELVESAFRSHAVRRAPEKSNASYIASARAIASTVSSIYVDPWLSMPCLVDEAFMGLINAV